VYLCAPLAGRGVYDLVVGEWVPPWPGQDDERDHREAGERDAA
jgi:hypothetical protein